MHGDNVARVWVSVDGVEGAGKSTLIAGLKSVYPDALDLPEFSESVVGQALAAAVDVSPHRISPSATAQTLLFLAEFHEKVEIGVLGAPPGSLVLTDRGLMSKYVYQVTVLAEEWGHDRASEWVSTLLAGIDPPDLTICLTAEPQALLQRIEERGNRHTPEQQAFVRVLRDQFLIAPPRGRTLRIDTTDLGTDAVLSIALGALRDIGL
jgi:thymidylate kinase